MPFPSDQQAQVIAHRGGPLVVVAGPGTGKTRTLVERMIGLLQEDRSREVTFITFTRTSRRDTERKLTEALGEQASDEAELMFPRTATLHTYAKRLAHRFSHIVDREPSFSILIDGRGESALLIEELAADLGLVIDRKTLSDAVAEARATSQWPAGFPVDPGIRPAILPRFDRLLRLYRTFDIQGLVTAASTILASEESALPPIFLQVDEYQDLNPSDQGLLSLLASHPASQLVVVGDDAQSIYGFRFADYLGIRDLWAADGWEKVRFQESHRLPAHVLNAALSLIAHRGYLGAELDQKPHSDRRIAVLQCTAPHLQVEAIARDIEARFTEVATTGHREPHLSDFLVLCPTTDQVRSTVAELTDRFGVPSHTPSRPTIPEDYWPVMLLLRIAADDDPLALRQWLPVLEISPEQILDLRNRALTDQVPFAQCCYRAGLGQLTRFQADISHIRDEASTSDRLYDALAAADGARLPREFRPLLESASRENGQLPRLPRLIQTLYEYFGVLDPEELVADNDKVLVATMHSAKGLEAEYVYCPWMSSTFMPVSRRDPEEERRVLYVALTRAKRDVLITFPETYDASHGRRLGRAAMSPFLEEIAAHLRILSTTAALVRTNPLPWFMNEQNAG